MNLWHHESFQENLKLPHITQNDKLSSDLAVSSKSFWRLAKLIQGKKKWMKRLGNL